eukprot:gene12553-13840_t
MADEDRRIARAAADLEEEEEQFLLKKELIATQGILLLQEQGKEVVIRNKIVFCLESTYGMIGERDFSFVKVTQRQISMMQLGKGTEYDYNVLKKLAGQGMLYLRIKPEYQCILSGNQVIDVDEEIPSSIEQPGDNAAVVPSVNSSTSQNLLTTHETAPSNAANYEFSAVLHEFSMHFTDPVEMLKYLRGKICTGRELNLSSLESEMEGEVNFITVD